ncbi:hypothetical protein ACES2J_08295 [Bdellovibrio bacteriovorus]|uniref:hypothetical protein n=1 Tax=Bdellovibrio bacteriovorus TaxID=959 RepID=UPI0035A6587E
MAKTKQETPVETPQVVTTYSITRLGDGFVLTEVKIVGNKVVSMSQLTEPDILDITAAKLIQIIRKG